MVGEGMKKGFLLQAVIIALGLSTVCVEAKKDDPKKDNTKADARDARRKERKEDRKERKEAKEAGASYQERQEMRKEQRQERKATFKAAVDGIKALGDDAAKASRALEFLSEGTVVALYVPSLKKYLQLRDLSSNNQGDFDKDNYKRKWWTLWTRKSVLKKDKGPLFTLTATGAKKADGTFADDCKFTIKKSGNWIGFTPAKVFKDDFGILLTAVPGEHLVCFLSKTFDAANQWAIEFDNPNSLDSACLRSRASNGYLKAFDSTLTNWSMGLVWTAKSSKTDDKKVGKDEITYEMAEKKDATKIKIEIIDAKTVAPIAAGFSAGPEKTGKADMISVGADSSGDLLAIKVSGNKLFKYDVDVAFDELRGTSDDPWVAMDMTGLTSIQDVSVSSDGVICVLANGGANGGTPFQYDATSGKFVPMTLGTGAGDPKTFIKIVAGNKDNIWAISSTNDLIKFISGGTETWEKGHTYKLAVGVDGYVLVANKDGKVCEKGSDKGRFPALKDGDKPSRNMAVIAIGSKDQIYGIDAAGLVYQYTNGAWTATDKASGFKAVSVNAGGSMWLLDAAGTISFNNTNGYQVSSIPVTSSAPIKPSQQTSSQEMQSFTPPPPPQEPPSQESQSQELQSFTPPPPPPLTLQLLQQTPPLQLDLTQVQALLQQCTVADVPVLIAARDAWIAQIGSMNAGPDRKKLKGLRDALIAKITALTGSQTTGGNKKAANKKAAVNKSSQPEPQPRRNVPA